MNIIINGNCLEQPPLYEAASHELTVVIAGLALGGAERIVLDWAIRIHPKWKVHIIVLRDHAQEWGVPDFIRVTRLYNSQVLEKLTAIGADMADAGQLTCLCHLLRKAERDALGKSGIFTVPVLHNAQAGWFENTSKMKKFPVAIAVSEACAKDLRESGWKGTSSVIRHIPRPRNFSPETRETFRKAWNIPSAAIVIGMIGGVKPQKDYLSALRILKEMPENMYLVILGGPIGRNGKKTWEEVTREIHRLGLRNRVAMPGFIPDAGACLPAFDVMLNTSHYEGFSIATTEALVNGMPVVASAVGGQGELADPGLTLLSKKSPAKTWATALKKVIGTRNAPPAWANFPSYRLWTLASLARPVGKSEKILFVTANLNSGGAQRSLVNLVGELQGKMSIEVAVTGNSTASYFFEQIEGTGIRVSRTFDSRDTFDHAEMLVRKICSEQIGTVCFWNLDPKIKLLLAKTLGFTKVRFVDVSPGDNSFDEMGDVAEFQRLICFDSKEFYGRLDKLVLKYNGRSPAQCKNKVQVIPNGILIPKKIKSDYSILSAPRIAVHGRITPTKFTLEIIAAMKAVWEEIPAAELHVFGGTETRHQKYAEAVIVASASETDKRIFFHGPDFETPSRLSEYDAYIVLGKDQGCPNALLEALAAGLPAVANDNGGTREQIVDGKTGLLIPDCSPQSAAKALIRILLDRNLAEKLGRNGCKHVMESFAMKKMALDYSQVLGRKKFALKNLMQWFTVLYEKITNNKNNKEGEKNENNVRICGTATGSTECHGI